MESHEEHGSAPQIMQCKNLQQCSRCMKDGSFMSQVSHIMALRTFLLRFNIGTIGVLL